MAQDSSEIREGSSTDEIRLHIEETRAEMSETIDAIQSRLSPTRALADARDSLADATVGRVKRLSQRTSGWRSNILHRLQDNPLPFALLAAAATGLLVRGVTHGSRRRRHENIPTKPLQHDAERVWSAGDTVPRHEGSQRRRVAGVGDTAAWWIAAASTACWAIWKAEAAAASFRKDTTAR